MRIRKLERLGNKWKHLVHENYARRLNEDKLVQISKRSAKHLVASINVDVCRIDGWGRQSKLVYTGSFDDIPTGCMRYQQTTREA